MVFENVTRKGLKKKIVLFWMTGGIATLIDMLFFNLFFASTSMFVFSRICGITLSMVFNFTSNRNITFKAKNKKAHQQLWKFLIIYCISMGVNILVGKEILSLLNPSTLSANIAVMTSLFISGPLSFCGLMFWVFKE